jgi:hypothetical protein
MRAGVVPAPRSDRGPAPPTQCPVRGLLAGIRICKWRSHSLYDDDDDDDDDGGGGGGGGGGGVAGSRTGLCIHVAVGNRQLLLRSQLDELSKFRSGYRRLSGAGGANICRLAHPHGGFPGPVSMDVLTGH